MGLGYNSSTKHELYLMECTLNKIREWLVTPITFRLLLHHECIFPGQSTVVQRICNLGELLIFFFTNSVNKTSQYFEN